MKTLFAFAALISLLAVPSSSQSFPAAEATKLAHEYLTDIYADQTSALWKNMTAEMQSALKSEVDFANTSRQINAQLGKEISVDTERTMPAPHAQVYTRLARFSAVPIAVVVMFSFDDSGKIAGLYFRPAQNPAESKYLDYKDKTKYFLPLKGTWLVYQGGRSTFDNYHAAFPDERFAYDIVGVQEGRLYSGSGDKVEDYFGFGKPVAAPADGSVVSAVDEYDDNPVLKPSEKNPKQGNNVVIDHGNGEFSMLAHLKRGSVKVKAGDKVKAGQEMALCGNSGNSPFPHVHYHLQTTSEWFHGDGLPLQFHDYTANGKSVNTGEPVQGDVIASK